MFLGGEIRNEGEMGDLDTRPPELEDTHEDGVIGELCPLVRVLATEAAGVDEGEADAH